MASKLLSERRGAAMVLTISDPATRNTLSPDVYESGAVALRAAAADADVRAVIVHGDGAHFCAGGDLQRLAASREGPADTVRANIDRFHAFVLAMRDCPKPVIAAVEGHAAGGGCYGLRRNSRFVFLPRFAHPRAQIHQTRTDDTAAGIDFPRGAKALRGGTQRGDPAIRYIYIQNVVDLVGRIDYPSAFQTQLLGQGCRCSHEPIPSRVPCDASPWTSPPCARRCRVLPAPG